MVIILAKIIGSIVFGLLAGCGAVYIFNKMPASWLCDYGQRPEDNPLLAAEMRAKVRREGDALSVKDKESLPFDPDKEDPYFKRIKENPWRWVYSFGFMCLCLRLSLWGAAEAFTVLTPGDAAFQIMETTQLAAAGLFACWALLMIALSDYKYMIIPDQFVLMLALTSFGFVPFYKTPAFVTDILVSLGLPGSNNATAGGMADGMTSLANSPIWQPIGGLIIGAGFMLLVALLGRLITRKEVMGFGDIKLCAALGLVLGIQGTAIAMVLAILAGGVIAAIGLMTGRLKKNSAMPMGPSICGSAMAYILIAMPYMI